MKSGRFKINLLFKNTLLFIVVFQFNYSIFSQEILQGAERVSYYSNKLNNKKVAIIANNTSVIKTKNGRTHIIDTLISKGISIEKIFSPEHGFLGDKDDGEKFENTYYKNIEVISLYGKNRKLRDSDIEDIDILIFDIQDVGVRFYTYLSTLHYAMESAARRNKKFIIMDRANPNSFYIDGPVLDIENKSFIGLHPVPIVYGMTIGEYGLMINGEGWLGDNLKVDLEVIKIENYNHNLKYVPPIRPSPNLPNIQSIYLYPSLAFMEKTEVSVGRGTKTQFQVYGHPDFNDDFSFTPQPNFGSQYPKLEGIKSYGKDLRGYKTSTFIELKWLIDSYDQIIDKTKFFRSDFDKLSGSSLLRKQIINRVDEEDIRNSWNEGLEKFKKIRQKYLLY
tara:strand:+ start:1461 stop:2636 length:1176 start_codon:yes stop_codon:yes gene_type:complete